MDKISQAGEQLARGRFGSGPTAAKKAQDYAQAEYEKYMNEYNEKHPTWAAASTAQCRNGGGDDTNDVDFAKSSTTTTTTTSKIPMSEITGEHVNAIMDNIQAPKSSSDEEDDNSPNAFVTQRKSDQVLYDLSQFSESNMVFSKDPMQCEKGGEILYINYKYSKQTHSSFLLNTPRLFCPGGVITFKDTNGDKMSALLSLGRSWSENENLVAFRNTMDRIQGACVNVIYERKWAGPKATKEQIAEAFSPIVYVKTDVNGVDYPPAMGTVISNSKSCKTHIMKAPKLIPVHPGAVVKGSSLTCVIELRWIHKKPQGNRKAYPLGFSFSVHIAISQAIYHAPTNGLSRDVCVVQYSAAEDDTQTQTDCDATTQPRKHVHPSTSDNGIDGACSTTTSTTNTMAANTNAPVKNEAVCDSE